jgi:hypothetical protein
MRFSAHTCAANEIPGALGNQRIHLARLEGPINVTLKINNQSQCLPATTWRRQAPGTTPICTAGRSTRTARQLLLDAGEKSPPHNLTCDAPTSKVVPVTPSFMVNWHVPVASQWSMLHNAGVCRTRGANDQALIRLSASTLQAH